MREPKSRAGARATKRGSRRTPTVALGRVTILSGWLFGLALCALSLVTAILLHNVGRHVDAAGSLLVGDQNVLPLQDSNSAGMAEAFQYIASTNGTIDTLNLYVDSGSVATSAIVGLYANNSATNNPGTLLTQATILNPAAGSWNAVSSSPVTVTAGTTYWIAVLEPPGAGRLFIRDGTNGTKAQTSLQSNLTSLPATWSPGQNWGPGKMSAYAAVNDSNAPAISNLLVSYTGPLSAIITWQTDEASTSEVIYGVGTPTQSSGLDTTRQLAHSVTLPNLRPSTAYTFLVRSVDSSGNVAQSTAVSLTTAPQSADASSLGMWSQVMPWPIVPIHAMYTYTGDIVAVDGWELPSAITRVYDPDTALGGPVFVDSIAAAGIFCGAHVQLADGRILIVGGHQGGEVGIRNAFTFDPNTKQWTARAQMAQQRWYPSLTLLGDGRAVVVSGNTVPGSWANTPEIYNPATNTWSNIGVNTSVMREVEYPLSFLMPSGKIMVIGPESNAVRLLDPNAATWVDPGIGALPMRFGTAAMYRPGKILYTGGGPAYGGSTVKTTAVVDMTSPTPAWRTTQPMAFGRYHHNLVVLPDGKVLALGGATTVSTETASGVVAPELWDPATETWTTLPSQQLPRMYHSTALLLPDGRVMSAGGGRWSIGPNFPNAEFYSPPYLFQGARPVIDSAPTFVDYGANVDIGTADATTITSVALVSLGQVTHSLDMNQHFVPLTYTSSEGHVTAVAPVNPNDAPPGYYMLFVLREGVPSVAKIVKLGGTAPPATPVPSTTATATMTPAFSQTPSPTRTSTSTPTRTSTASPTRTPTMVASPSPSAMPSSTSSVVPSPTSTTTWSATSTPTPTPSVLATATVTTFGRTSSAGQNDGSDYGYFNGYRATLSSPGTLKSLSVYVGATSPGAHIRLALYTTNSSGNPGTLLAQTGEANAVAGWNTLTIPGLVSLSATRYWIIALTDDPETVYRLALNQGSGQVVGWRSANYGAFPVTISGWQRYTTIAFSMYGSVQTSP